MLLVGALGPGTDVLIVSASRLGSALVVYCSFGALVDIPSDY